VKLGTFIDVLLGLDNRISKVLDRISEAG
jgi:hypothetical protein